MHPSIKIHTFTSLSINSLNKLPSRTPCSFLKKYNNKMHWCSNGPIFFLLESPFPMLKLFSPEAVLPTWLVFLVRPSVTTSWNLKLKIEELLCSENHLQVLFQLFFSTVLWIQTFANFRHHKKLVLEFLFEALRRTDIKLRENLATCGMQEEGSEAWIFNLRVARSILKVKRLNLSFEKQATLILKTVKRALSS